MAQEVQTHRLQTLLGLRCVFPASAGAPFAPESKEGQIDLDTASFRCMLEPAPGGAVCAYRESTEDVLVHLKKVGPPGEENSEQRIQRVKVRLNFDSTI
jgi:hypothetical protein